MSAETSQLHLEIPRQFLEHHNTAIVSYRGVSARWYDLKVPRRADVHLPTHDGDQDYELILPR
jgi:hypothetical protein